MTASPRLTGFARSRFSPVLFDENHVMSQGDVDSLLDAARLAPSAGNSQPWSFIVGRRGDDVHQRLVCHLARSSASWAPSASLLVANMSQRFVEGSTFEYSEFAQYDLGQAVAHLTFQTHALGLAVHQFRAFDRDAIAVEFGVPPHWEVTTMAAIGSPVGAAETHVGSGTSRERRAANDVTWARVMDPDEGQ
ncbi:MULTISPECIES: nitroreductase family protein [unclassified Nocardioides]|uniref:nitroreductase family protein n=1 Tax=unclassified Nocardioides TaxID=2615069 RepID=UPI0006F9718E|nr:MULTISPECIES: nitroreductase family protein [unclassified Nocardioides]KRA39161.1 nitroreductase [Nocardioides sp. Root614]KRA93120.1 nitroreductase [Nocardioides sp. Root682]